MNDAINLGITYLFALGPFLAYFFSSSVRSILGDVEVGAAFLLLSAFRLRRMGVLNLHIKDYAIFFDRN